MDNASIAAALEELADRQALAGQSHFRLRAFRTAASRFRDLPVSLEVLSSEGRLTDLEGVGPAIAEKVRDLLETGTFPALDRAREEVPDVLLELTRVPGIGARTAHAIVGELSAESMADVVAAAESGALSAVPGVGAKAIGAIKAHAASAEQGEADGGVVPPGGPWFRRDRASAAGAALAGQVLHVAEGEWAHAGELATGEELVAVADVVVAGVTAEEVLARADEHRWLRAGEVPPSPAGEEADAAVLAPTGAPVRCWIARDAGSVAGRVVEVSSPASFSGDEAVALELRGRVAAGELGEAAAVQLSGELVQVAYLRGELHSHSTWSDGKATVLEMARAARALGHEWHVVTDHSAPYALVNGLGEQRLLEQAEEIARANEQLAREEEVDGEPPMRVYQGTEVEVLPDGSLGLPDDVLARLDWVVASIHQSQRQPGPVLDARIARVLANPLVDMVGHPTSRLLLKRPRTAIDVDEMVERAVAAGVVLECNANPARLDLGAEHLALVLARGGRIAIDTDAHSPGNFAYREHGVSVARRAGARTADVVNCLAWEQLQALRPRNQA